MEQQTASGVNRLALTVAESAKMLGTSQKTIYRLLQRGLLKALPSLRRKQITRKSLEAFVASAV